jgi:SAM-dependent methyltransferase
MSDWDTYCQLSHQTKLNRFPKIFESARELRPFAKRILSFGCSTGEEAFTLADNFPESEIVGVDIDWSSVSTARRNNKFKDRVYFHTEVGATGLYDLVTCFMVLFALDKPIPKDRWSETVKTIDKHVALGGLLMVYTSEYDFLSSEISYKYDVEREWKRTHEKNKKEYYCGYYSKKTILTIPPKNSLKISEISIEDVA